MKSKTLSHNSWLPLVKGAGRALAMTEGLLVVAILAITLSLFNITPVNAASSDEPIMVDSDCRPWIVGGYPDETEIIDGRCQIDVEYYNDTAGFDVTMSSSTSETALLSTRNVNGNPDKIKTVTGTLDNPAKLEINTYGYSLDMNSDKNNPIWIGLKPAGQADQIFSTDKAAGNHSIDVRIGAKLNTGIIREDVYRTEVTITATAKLPPATFGPSTDDYGTNGKVQIDYDEHMIPVKYTGNEDKAQWTSLTYQEIADNPKDWYNYPEKQWANAVTVKADKLADYQNKSTTINEEDVLGYWVYIPRYSYEVMRRDATDKVVQPQDFDIKFETKGDIKKVPATSCNAGIKTLAQMWKNKTADNVESNILAKDYRTGCKISRTYPGNTIGKSEADQQTNQNSDTTWATHPAFSWCKTVAEDGTKSDCTELNGIWVGKFETTGSTKEPTVLPTSKHIGENRLGVYYDIAKSIGVEDKLNVGGQGTDITQNSHNLVNNKSSMLKNNEWGAVTYLSASRYGSGFNGVMLNSNNQEGSDGNGKPSSGITGCGPASRDDNSGTYNDGVTAGNNKTCSTADPQRSYNGTLGQSASTTGNTYGIYDMAGGAYEYVAVNLSTSDVTTPSDANTFKNQIGEPYVNIFTESTIKRPDWSIDSDFKYYINDACTWDLCGGQALHEVRVIQSIRVGGSSWLGSSSTFLYADKRWAGRGGAAGAWLSSSIYYSGSEYSGWPNQGHAFRVTIRQY